MLRFPRDRPMTHAPSVLGSLLRMAIGLCLAGSRCALAEEEGGMPDGISVQFNVPYREGPGKNWTLDLARPNRALDKPRPAIVVIHGGGWLEGDKSSFSTPKNRPPGNILDFAQLGLVEATINY